MRCEAHLIASLLGHLEQLLHSQAQGTEHLFLAEYQL